MTERTCSVEGCEARLVARGMCNRHWKQWRKTHDPAINPPVRQDRPRRPILDRFWEKVDKTGDCWLWCGATRADGYGVFWVEDDGLWRAHRFSWFLATGQRLSRRLQLDHKCYTPACVNPAHLHVVTNQLNSQNRRGAQKNSATGVRGVTWRENRKKYQVRVKAPDGRYLSGGSFAALTDAEAAAIELRNRLMVKNLADRQAG